MRWFCGWEKVGNKAKAQFQPGLQAARLSWAINTFEKHGYIQNNFHMKTGAVFPNLYFQEVRSVKLCTLTPNIATLGSIFDSQLS